VTTECNTQEFAFQGLGSRVVTARFDGGAITSDAGGLLLREVEAKTGILRRFAACFSDHRDPERVEHTVGELIAQRVFALALGYEDLNDHDTLRHDPLLAILVGKADPTGQDRRRSEDRGKSLAGKSTLNRLELTPVGADGKSRYKKIVARHHDIDSFFVETFLALHPKPPQEIVLDLSPPTIRSTAISWAGSFTATTTAIVTCRCTFSAANICCAPSCGRRTSTARPVP